MTNRVSAFEPNLLSSIREGRMADAKFIIQNTKNAQKLIDYENWTLLHYAADCGNGGVARYLIDLGSNVNEQNLYGQTPLALAVEKERVTTIRVLLDNDASIYVNDRGGKSALHAVVHGSLFCQNTIQVFLKKLQNDAANDCRLIAHKLRDIDCPLRVAIFLNNAEITRCMLDLMGDDRKIDDSDGETGETALHIAVRISSLENVKVLIEYGANLNAETSVGYTPLHYLSVDGDHNMEILNILLERGAMMITSDKDGKKRCQISCILECARKEVINLLMQYELDLLAVDSHKCTPIHYLARNRNANVFDALQDKQFDVNACNDASYTPLQLACGNLSSMKFLLSQGADVDAFRYGITPLIKILQMATNRQLNLLESVQVLLQYDADPERAFDDESVVYRILMGNRMELIEPILARLALLDEMEFFISEEVIERIEENGFLQRYYDTCKTELVAMKNTIVWESITMYKLLTVSDEQMAMYARQSEFRAIVSPNEFHFGACYEYFGRKRVEKAIETADLWMNSSVTLCDLLKLPREKYYNVIENMIISYLSENDMRNLCLIADL